MEDQNNESQPPILFDESSLPTALDVAAIQVHEIYLAFQNSGFTKKEALELVGFIVAASGIMEPTQYDPLDDLDKEPKSRDNFDDDDDFGEPIF